MTDLGTSDWVLLGYNVFSAKSLGAATITTGIPTLHGNVEPLIGLTRTNDGVLSQSDIEYHSANLTVTPQPTTLESPEITVVSYGANRHLVTWDAVPDATSYEVAYSTNQMNWTTVTTPTTSAIVSGLTYGSTVYYKVRSISGSGASDYSLVTAKIVCPMDVDGDGIVATADYGLLSQKWFTYSGSSMWDPRADVDGDGIIGPGDLNYVSANWFKYATDSTLVYPAAKSFDSVFETPDADFALDTLLPDDGADFLFDEDADFLPSLDILW